VKAAGALAGGSSRLHPDQAGGTGTETHRLSATYNYASDDIHPIHLHRHSFELTRVAGQMTSGVIKDVVMVSNQFINAYRRKRNGGVRVYIESLWMLQLRLR
jgi:hypothetical protein